MSGQIDPVDASLLALAQQEQVARGARRTNEAAWASEQRAAYERGRTDAIRENDSESRASSFGAGALVMAVILIGLYVVVGLATGHLGQFV